jgi:hypothetical protein
MWLRYEMPWLRYEMLWLRYEMLMNVKAAGE